MELLIKPSFLDVLLYVLVSLQIFDQKLSIIWLWIIQRKESYSVKVINPLVEALLPKGFVTAIIPVPLKEKQRKTLKPKVQRCASPTQFFSINTKINVLKQDKVLYKTTKWQVYYR